MTQTVFRVVLAVLVPLIDPCPRDLPFLCFVLVLPLEMPWTGFTLIPPMPARPRIVLLVIASCIRSCASGSNTIRSLPTPRTSAASLLLLLRFNYSQPLWVQDPESEFGGSLQDLHPLPTAYGAAYPDDVLLRDGLHQVVRVVYQNLSVTARMIAPDLVRAPVANLDPLGIALERLSDLVVHPLRLPPLRMDADVPPALWPQEHRPMLRYGLPDLEKFLEFGGLCVHLFCGFLGHFLPAFLLLVDVDAI